MSRGLQRARCCTPHNPTTRTGRGRPQRVARVRALVLGCAGSQGFPGLPRASQGFPGLPRASQGFPGLPRASHADRAAARAARRGGGREHLAAGAAAVAAIAGCAHTDVGAAGWPSSGGGFPGLPRAS